MDPYTLEYKTEILLEEWLVNKSVAADNHTNASLIALLFLIWAGIIVQIKSIILIIKSIFFSKFQLSKVFSWNHTNHISHEWMFYEKCGNNLIMKTHYRFLWAIYNTQTKTYRDLLHIHGKIDIYTQNIHILMTEIYKCLNRISPPFTWDYYYLKSNHYNLRGKHLLKLNNRISTGWRRMDSTPLFSKVQSYGKTSQTTLRKQSLYQSSKP